MDKKEVKKDVPFFAQFLEDQEFPRVKSRIKAGKKPGGGNWPPVVTLKYPSDDDDDPPTIPF